MLAWQALVCYDLYYNFKLDAFVVSHPDTGEMIVDDLSDGFRQRF